jgi:uncharacterized protein (TIRG00374 family)
VKLAAINATLTIGNPLGRSPSESGNMRRTLQRLIAMRLPRAPCFSRDVTGGTQKTASPLQPEESGPPEHRRRPARMWRRLARPAVLLVLGGVGIYLLLPSLLSVFGSWRSLEHLDWPFAILAVACESASFVCLWKVDQIALRSNAWFPVAAAQLSGNAAGHVLPGGGATATAVSATMLRRAGFDTGQAAAAFGASSALQLATTLALPVLALPVILGGTPVDHSLAVAAYLGAALFVLLIGAGAIAFTTDRPLELAGRAVQWLLNATVTRRRHISGFAEQLIKDRNYVRATLGEHWRMAVLAAAGNTGFDYFALLAALRAVGAEPQPSLVLLAYATAKVLALVPLTPGGLGFVEAGLVGTLRVAGVRGGDALTATLLYRIVAYWLPLAAGGIAYLLFRRRYGAARTQPLSPAR